MKRILCLLIALLLLTPALASCGKKKPATTQRTEEASATETTAATTDKWDVLAPEVAGLTESTRRFKIECSSFVNAEKAARNDIYIEGPEKVEEGVTATIQQMVYERNRTANDLLGTSAEYVYWDETWGAQAPKIAGVVQGHADDAPDLFINMIYDLNLTLRTVGAFKDVWSIPGSYFDFDAEGWMTSWMESASLTGDRAYVLASDYFVDLLRSMSVLPFNMTMMDANAVKLAPALDQTVGQGEELTPLFFDFVEQGKWTWDVLGKLCEAIWEDSDGNGQDSVGDRLGIIADEYGGLNAAIFIYSCGEELTETERDPATGRQTVRYPEDPAALGAIFDAVAGVFSGTGSFSTYYKMDGATPDQPGAAYHHIKFGQGELLTAGGCVLAALEDEAFQRMENLYSVVPLPKVNAEKEYNTFIHNIGDAGAINVNTSPMKARALSAYLQYCTEHSTEIREEFLEVVTKYKTTTYNQGTDRMFNLIYAGIVNGRDKTIEDMIGGDKRWHQMLKGGHFQGGSAALSSSYLSTVQAKQSTLNTILEEWQTLPGGTETEPAGE